MSEEWVIRNLRNMAWERAKGELLSMRHTFWSGKTGHQFEELTDKIERFIKDIEENGLHE